MKTFAAKLIAWQKRHAPRPAMAEQRDPYAIWVSEIMLQQPGCRRHSLLPALLGVFRILYPRRRAADEVLAHWTDWVITRGPATCTSRPAHCAQPCRRFPADYESARLRASGVRPPPPSACFLRRRRAILDGNVKRVLARYLASRVPWGKRIEMIYGPGGSAAAKRDIEAYIQA